MLIEQIYEIFLMPMAYFLKNSIWFFQTDDLSAKIVLT